jgi:hypothetical protein
VAAPANVSVIAAWVLRVQRGMQCRDHRIGSVRCKLIKIYPPSDQ